MDVHATGPGASRGHWRSEGGSGCLLGLLQEGAWLAWMPSRLRCSRPRRTASSAAQNSVPARRKPTTALRPGQGPSPARDEPHERVRRVRLARRPGHELDGDAATPAVNSAHRVRQEDRDPPERHEREQPRRERVIPRASTTRPELRHEKRTAFGPTNTRRSPCIMPSAAYPSLRGSPTDSAEELNVVTDRRGSPACSCLW